MARANQRVLFVTTTVAVSLTTITFTDCNKKKERKLWVAFNWSCVAKIPVHSLVNGGRFVINIAEKRLHTILACLRML